MKHDIYDLIRIFNEFALPLFQTILVEGSDEPIYLPADETHPHHRIVFAHGYFASALHEISHWCIAGGARRQLVDYGYWYVEDGRNQQQQADFEAVEVKPQAIEALLSEACQFNFQVSCDNLNGVDVDRHAFSEKVQQQVALYLQGGLPPRAAALIKVFADFYQPHLDVKRNSEKHVA